jgi:hypothetical protein
MVFGIISSRGPSDSDSDSDTSSRRVTVKLFGCSSAINKAPGQKELGPRPRLSPQASAAVMSLPEAVLTGKDDAQSISQYSIHTADDLKDVI